MIYENGSITKDQCEFLRSQAKTKFDQVRGTWIDCLQWALPYRAKWLLSQTEGERNNHHVVDPTHVLALRSYVAGFLEGNTSATRPWYRIGTADPERNMVARNHEWLDIFTRLTLKAFASGNFYHAAGEFYYDYGTINTGSYFIDERPNGTLHFHVLIPGSYYAINNAWGEATCLVREYSMSVKALVKYFGRKVDGDWDWSNFTSGTRKLWEEGNYTQMIDVVEIIKENPDYDYNRPEAGVNRRWHSIAYELASINTGPYYQAMPGYGTTGTSREEKDKFLKVSYAKRKPFIVGKSQTNGNFEYGEKGPTLDALGLIKSLNKKAISKDMAIEQMIKPAMQGPSNLKKSYMSTAPNTFVPLDAQSISAKQGLRPLFEMNPGIGALVGDVMDMRQQVDRLYYADYLLYLSQNPKTRTAEETKAVVQEQQLIIGPNLQSLNWTHNVPVVEFVMDYVLDNDPYLPPPPDDLAGQFLKPEFISVFAQAQKAADLPSINQYVQMLLTVGQINPAVFTKANLDRLCDIYEDRLYLPHGLNRDQSEVDAMREQQAAMAQKQMQLEAMTKVAGAAKDVGLQANQEGVSQ